MIIRAKLGDDLSKKSAPLGNIEYTNSQDVNFLYVITQGEITDNNIEWITTGTSVKDGIVGRSPNYIPSKIPYTNINPQSNGGIIQVFGKDGLICMNYNAGGRISEDIYGYRRYGIMTIPRDDYVSAISIYKKEIWYTIDGNNQPIANEETNYHLVTNVSDSGSVYDFNIGNNRYYKYLFRFVYSGTSQASSGSNSAVLAEGLKEIIIPVKTAWLGWTLTELHEVPEQDSKVYGNTKVYTASLKDVWKFKYNISPGDYTQNVSKTKQDTLATYPKFVHGLLNSMSGQVSCLLGRDVIPYELSDYSYVYEKENSVWGWKKITQSRGIGGYTEELWPDVNYIDRTSNRKIDMFNQWRKFCYSGNPKLLKDAVGNRYIVQVHDTSSHIEETWSDRPITISFSWTQIEDANNCQIIKEGE